MSNIVQNKHNFLCKMKTIFFGIVLFISTTAVTAKSPALILTPYIKSNHIDAARNASKVESAFVLNLTSYSAFFTVDERYNSNIFWWYFPVEDKPVAQTPWIVWLQGGPGASSIAGLFDEIGPLEYVDRKLKARESSWTKIHSVLFIDNPIGAGYSFTDSNQGYIRNMSTCATHLYKVLQQFITIFPELRNAPLYIAGESYAGRYIPALALKILEQDIELGPLNVDLRGLILGNPVLNREVIADYSQFFYQWGLIDSQGLLAVKPLQDSFFKAIKDGDGVKAMDYRNQLLDRLDDISLQMQNFNVLEDNVETRVKGFMEYLTHPVVEQAIHVGTIKFTFSNATVHSMLSGDFLSEVTTKIEKLLEHYRILIYCGQLDLTAPCVPNAEDRRKKWKWSKREYFLNAPRTPWWFNNTVAGYVKSGGGLTEVLVRGAGHLVPMDKPAEIQKLVSFFIRGLDMPIPPNYEIRSIDTPEYKEPESKTPGTNQIPPSGSKTTMIISIFMNVILVLVLIAGVVYCLRWKHRVEMFSYNNVQETSITEGVLTLS